VRLIIRGFKNGRRVFEEHVESDVEDLALLAEKHTMQLLGTPHMIEFEFPDEPDPNERSLRIGTDPRAMVRPMRLDDLLRKDRNE